jgi:hypothetical protein
MLIPTDEEIRAFPEKYAPTQAVFELVYTHCEIVCGIADGFGVPDLAPFIAAYGHATA